MDLVDPSILPSQEVPLDGSISESSWSSDVATLPSSFGTLVLNEGRGPSQKNSTWQWQIKHEWKNEDVYSPIKNDDFTSWVFFCSVFFFRFSFLGCLMQSPGGGGGYLTSPVKSLNRRYTSLLGSTKLTTCVGWTAPSWNASVGLPRSSIGGVVGPIIEFMSNPNT